jgi:hypothetical protein
MGTDRAEDIHWAMGRGHGRQQLAPIIRISHGSAIECHSPRQNHENKEARALAYATRTSAQWQGLAIRGLGGGKGPGLKTRVQTSGPKARIQKLRSVQKLGFKSSGPKARVPKLGSKNPGPKARVQTPGSKSSGSKPRVQKPGFKSSGPNTRVRKPGSKNPGPKTRV